MKTKNLITSAVLTAIVCLATIVVKFPLALGYVNLGDCFVLLSAFLLPMPYCLFPAAIGSCLADVFSGYAVYAPATFIIKGLMALSAYFIFKTLKRFRPVWAYLLSAIIAEFIMVFGYLVFETVLYGFGVAIVNVPFNFLQSLVAVVTALLSINILKKIKFFNL